ncbi:hypothetical protein QYE76_044301 [Lolium multiflorum]|uniref:Signal peptidase complex subunit 2 n=1 Tax=Lolium multiflorum TaxID=4521 RepID=A0AAD8TKT6_LOLMU|nr:hypothetical protein QYE76_044301 [Lolium multiflorum]
MGPAGQKRGPTRPRTANADGRGVRTTQTRPKSGQSRGRGWHAASSRVRWSAWLAQCWCPVLLNVDWGRGTVPIESPLSTPTARTSFRATMASKREFLPSANDHEAGSSRRIAPAAFEMGPPAPPICERIYVTVAVVRLGCGVPMPRGTCTSPRPAREPRSVPCRSQLRRATSRRSGGAARSCRRTSGSTPPTVTQVPTGTCGSRWSTMRAGARASPRRRRGLARSRARLLGGAGRRLYINKPAAAPQPPPDPRRRTTRGRRRRRGVPRAQRPRGAGQMAALAETPRALRAGGHGRKAWRTPGGGVGLPRDGSSGGGGHAPATLLRRSAGRAAKEAARPPSASPDRAARKGRMVALAESTAPSACLAEQRLFRADMELRAHSSSTYLAYTDRPAPSTRRPLHRIDPHPPTSSPSTTAQMASDGAAATPAKVTPKKANLLDPHSIKHLLDETISEVVKSKGYAEDNRLGNWKLLIGTAVIGVALLAQFYPKKFPQNRDYTKEKDAIIFTHPPAGSFNSTGLVISSKLPRFSDMYNLSIASADPQSISAHKTVQFTKSVTKWFTKDGVLVEGLFWKDVERLVDDYNNERKSK